MCLWRAQGARPLCVAVCVCVCARTSETSRVRRYDTVKRHHACCRQRRSLSHAHRSDNAHQIHCVARDRRRIRRRHVMVVMVRLL